MANRDLDLVGEDLPDHGAGEHADVDLLAIGHERVARERVVVLPASQLPDAAHGGVGRAEPVALALPPDHALVIRGRDLPAALHQGAVGVEEELRIVEGAVIALVDAERDHHPTPSRGFRHCVYGGPGDRDGLLVELEVRLAHHGRGQDEREIWVIRDHRLREDDE